MPPSLESLDAAIKSQREAQKGIQDALDRRFAAVQLALEVAGNIACMALPPGATAPVELFKLAAGAMLK